MLETLGLNTVEDLFIDIPDQVRFDRELELPAPLAEPELYDTCTPWRPRMLT